MFFVPMFSSYTCESNQFKSRSRDLARDSGQRQLTSSKPNPCASSRAYACVAMLLLSIAELSVYLSGGLTPATETDLLPAAYRGGGHLTLRYIILAVFPVSLC